MKKITKWIMYGSVIIIFAWTLLTLWVERQGPSRITEMGLKSSAQTALVVYDPDPLYNLDQQVSESFGRVLMDSGWKVTIASVAAAKKLDGSSYKLFVLCANTYNWSPDWALTRYIKKQAAISGKNVVAITLGAGSTGRSKRILENLIKRKNARLIDSKTCWLWRPNDKSLPKESNVAIALAMTRKWAMDITVLLKEQN